MDEPSKEEKHAETTTMKVPFHKLFAFADCTDKVVMILGIIGAVGHGLTLPVMSFLSGELIDAFGHSGPDYIVASASKVILKFVYLAVFGGIAAFLQVACWMVSGERQGVKVRALYLKTILQQEIAYFDQQVNTGEVTRRMSADTILIQQATGEKVGKFIEVVAAFIGGFMVAFAKGWFLSLVLLSSIPLLITSGAIMFHLRSKIASRPQDAYADAANLVQQTLGSIRTVASFTGEKQAVDNYKKLLATCYESGKGEGFYSGLCVGTIICIMVCNYALAVWFGGKMILHKGYTGGQVFTVLLAIVIGSCSLGQASSSMAAFSAGQIAAFKMFETINRKPDIDVYDSNGKILDHICGDIELRDVYFCYPTRPKERIFYGFSLAIPSGMTTALVGQSGSGKSTVIGLIERFYDPQAGEILIDGIDLRTFQLKWIRSKIGLVSQEPVLFPTSIKDNIAYGKDGGAATLAEIRAAAELANAIDFIDKLPQGLDTLVGENGIQFSGGQKQRVAIARAILKDPRILLLDEATSALDANSEKTVQEALDKVMVNRTTVIVAHRLCTIRNANVIAVLHQGQLVEKGTHVELLKNADGVYFKLIHSQEENADNQYKPDSVADDGTVFHDRNLSRTMSFRSDGEGYSRRPDIVVNEHITYPETSSSLSSIYRLAHLNKPEVTELIVGVIFAIVTGAILPLFGYFLSGVVKTFYEMPHELKRDSEFWASMFILLGAVSIVAYPIKTHLFSFAGNKLVERIRLMYFKKVVNREVGWFDEPENLSGKLGARLNFDTANVRALVGDALAQLVELASSLVFGLAIAFRASWQLALIMLAMMPAIGFAKYVIVKSTAGFCRDAKEMYAEASQVATDAVGNIRTVASFCTQENILDTYKKKCEGPVANGTKQGLICGTGLGMSMCLVYLVFAASFYAGVCLVHSGIISMVDVFRVYASMNLIALAIASSFSLAPDSGKAKSAAASIFSIVDRKSKIDPSDESGMSPENVKGEIEFRNVYFTYPTRPGIQILTNLSLRIQSGKMVALVGESGSGKSTVIALLQRFYNPDSGYITLDRVDIDKFQVKWLRQQMGLVSQEPVLFNMTVRANIASGREGNATEEEIIAAAKLANAHEFISGLQEGYDTVVGERGVQLSGGQKQRVAIARAIVKSPKILLLDEATSALDSASEKIVQEALDRVMLNRTTVVVAHRLSTIRGADNIAVFKNGCIAEKGNHNTLITLKDGLYSSLVRTTVRPN